MNEFSDARWPAERHARVHHIQARKAFEPGSGAYPGRLISAVDGAAVVERFADHATVALVVARPERLAAVLLGAAWQRCRVHFMRNVLAKIPRASGEMVAAAIRTIFAQPDATHVAAQLDEITTMLHRQFPAVADMLTDARADLLAFSTFPASHWKKLWSTNPLERLNKEIKRRTNVVGIFPNDDAVVRLATAVIAETHDEWAVCDRRYLSEGSMNKLYDTSDPPALPDEITPAKIAS